MMLTLGIATVSFTGVVLLILSCLDLTHVLSHLVTIFWVKLSQDHTAAPNWCLSMGSWISGLRITHYMILIKTVNDWLLHTSLQTSYVLEENVCCVYPIWDSLPLRINECCLVFLIIAVSYWKEFLMMHEETSSVFIYQPGEKFHRLQETKLNPWKERQSITYNLSMLCICALEIWAEGI